MTTDSPLRPADPAEVADALAYALRYDGRRRVHHADDAMARITAERLIPPPGARRLRPDAVRAQPGTNDVEHATIDRLTDMNPCPTALTN